MNAMTFDTNSAVGVKHWRIAFVLGVVGMTSAMLLMPYLFAVMPQLAGRFHVALPVFVSAQTLQFGILSFLLAWLGLRLGYDYGLDSPWLRSRLRAGPAQILDTRWRGTISLGMSVGIVCVFLDFLYSAFVSHSLIDAVNPTTWRQGLLASFYGGIGEETVCRLFAVSLLVWIGARILRTATPNNAVYWTAIVTAAALFGVGHLLALAQIEPLGVANALRTIGLNALPGIAFGWLFWRRGFEHAMLGHFSADIVLHVLTAFGRAA